MTICCSPNYHFRPNTLRCFCSLNVAANNKIHTRYSLLHCESKNCATFIFSVTLANVGRFLKFFQCRHQTEMAHNKNEKFLTVA